MKNFFKKISAAGLVLATFLLGTFWGTGKAGAQTYPQNNASPRANMNRSTAANTRTIVGTITSMASDGSSMEVRIGSGMNARTVTIMVSSSTINRNSSGGNMIFSDFKVGDRVAAKGTVTAIDSNGKISNLSATSVRDLSSR